MAENAMLGRRSEMGVPAGGGGSDETADVSIKTINVSGCTSFFSFVAACLTVFNL